MPGTEVCPARLLTWMMAPLRRCAAAPLRRLRMCGRTARVSATGPKRCSSIRDRSCSSVVSSTAPMWPRPAALTRTSIRPYRAITSPTTSSIRAESVTSSSCGRVRSG